MHNLLGCSLCVAFVSTIRFPSLKLGTLCLLLLLVYDVFWVFYSEYFFKDNVMVSVATKTAVNPMYLLAKATNMSFLGSLLSTVELPLKLILPDYLTGAFLLPPFYIHAIYMLFALFVIQPSAPSAPSALSSPSALSAHSAPFDPSIP